tara:strand:- start:1298 stop:1417 length:120 start_codon:yes stop_codon:yes gene_type:complete
LIDRLEGTQYLLETQTKGLLILEKNISNGVAQDDWQGKP